MSRIMDILVNEGEPVRDTGSFFYSYWTKYKSRLIIWLLLIIIGGIITYTINNITLSSVLYLIMVIYVVIFIFLPIFIDEELRMY